MKFRTSLALQASLVVLALCMTVLRCWIRLRLERRSLTLPDYFVWGGWFFTLGWFICSTIALHMHLDNPLLPENDFKTESVPYLVTVFIASYCFDIGLYFPKASILSFYWWLIPRGFPRLRIALRMGTAYTACAFVASFLVDTCISQPISNNWSIENQKLSLWNSMVAVIINWVLNFSTNLLVFILPFFIVGGLQLRTQQKYALCGVLSLGLITITISLTRFIVFQVSSTGLLRDASGSLWFTAEMATATIVVSLPALKPLIMKATPHNTSNRGGSRYIRSGPRQSSGRSSYHSRMGGTSRACIEAGPVRDDEVQLVHQDFRKNSVSTTQTMGGMGMHQSNHSVKITTDITVLRESI